MKVEVGEYIRTKQGDIDKVILEYTGKCANPNCSAKHISCKSNYYDEEDIVKHSKSIIDLIEVGDYVNGKKVLEKIEKSFLGVSSSDIGNNRIYNYMIKSIVTKEQFSNMEYRL